MSFSCIGSEQFELEYESLSTSRYIGVNRGGSIEYTYSRGGEELTYTIEEDLSRIRTRCIGTFIGQGYTPCGQTQYWAYNTGTPFPNDRHEIVVIGSSYYEIKFFNDSPYRTDIPQYYIALEWVDKEVYDSLANQTYSVPYRRRHKNVRYYPGTCNSRNYGYTNAGNNAIVTHQFDAYRKGWLVKIYGDGILKKTVSTTNSLPDDRSRLNPSTVRVQDPSIYRASRTFTKEKDTQGVEIVTRPTTPHQKFVYLVNLDNNGNERSRNLIFEFSIVEGTGEPYYSLICAPVESVCPEGTCEVICGDTICCYGSDGIAVTSFPRT